MLGKYILDGKNPVKCDDLATWASSLSGVGRRVGIEKHDGIEVSTVFLGVDHKLGGYGPPILFETMVFGGPLDTEQERYCTWEEAEAGHKAMCEKVFKTKGG